MKAIKAIPITLASLAGLAALFAVMGAVGVASWEYTNSDSFCTNACHEVHPENAFAHHASQHANVQCVECHVGRISTFPAMIEKAGHVTHAWAKFVGYDRPLTAPSLPAARDSCEGCHTTDPHRHNSLSLKRHFASDEKNTESKTTLVVRSVGRPFHSGDNKGIREHTYTNIRFIATDIQRQDIPWIEATRPDGTVVTYQDPRAGLDADAIAAADKRTMECVDCHNLVGHPVLSPDDLADAALANGTLDPRFPHLKARVVELLNQPFKDRDEAMALLEQAGEQYRQDYPDLAEQYPEAWERRNEFLEQRQEQMAGMLLRNQFSAADISWRSFPDRSAHRNSPGCFRCHSGRHQSEDGTLIPVNCTSCHGIPVVTTTDTIRGKILDLTDMERPESHQVQDFVSRHYELYEEDDADCEGCHGEIEYGDDNETFCANSGCHDAKLPGLSPP
jgi:hypothetical protein